MIEPAISPSGDSRGGASQLRSLRIIHMAMVAGVVIYLGLSYFLNYHTARPLLQIDAFICLVLEYGTIVFSLSCLAISSILFMKKLGASSSFDVPARFSGYREAFIIRIALLEGAAFFCTVSYMLTSRLLFALEALALLCVMIYLTPGLNRVAEELNLNPNEINWLRSE